MTVNRLIPGRGRRVGLIAAAAFAVFGLAVASAALWLNSGRSLDNGTSLIGGSFNLVDQNNRSVTVDTFKGQPFVVFFGYTHCPDVCPTTLADLSQALATMGKDKPIRALFITVDPERDTPAVMKDYLSSFDPRILGLTGTPDAVTSAEKAYRVYARKVPSKDGDYSMDHTSVVYLMNRDGRFVQALNLQQPPEKTAAEIDAAS